MIAALGLLALSWGANCDFPHNPALPFSIVLSAPVQTKPLFEVWVEAQDGQLDPALFEAFEAREIQLLVIVPPPPEKDSKIWEEWVSRALAADHSVAIHLPQPPNWSTAPYQSLQELKRVRKHFRSLSGKPPLGVAASVPNKQAEATLLKAGYDLILELDGAHKNRPRLSAYYPNQMSMGLIVPSGRWDKPCEGPLQWSSTVADRVTTALMQTPTDPYAVLRIPLTAKQIELPALTQWLDENYRNHHPETIHPRTFRSLSWKRAVHNGVENSPIKRTTSLGRRFPARYVLEIARYLVSQNPLPRELPHNLNLTEGYAALIGLLAQSEDHPVLLAPLEPPTQLAISQWVNTTATVSRDSVVSMARQLNASPGNQVPNAIRIDNAPFTAAEFLILMSQAALGEENPTTGLVRVPDPRAKDLGWGRSGP